MPCSKPIFSVIWQAISKKKKGHRGADPILSAIFGALTKNKRRN